MLKTGIYVDAENVRLCGGYGMRYYVLNNDGLQTESVFFHCSKSNVANDVVFLDSSNIFEFDIVQNPENNNRTEAVQITLLEN